MFGDNGGAKKNQKQQQHQIRLICDINFSRKQNKTPNIHKRKMHIKNKEVGTQVQMLVLYLYRIYTDILVVCLACICCCWMSSLILAFANE